MPWSWRQAFLDLGLEEGPSGAKETVRVAEGAVITSWVMDIRPVPREVRSIVSREPWQRTATGAFSI